MDTFGVVEKIEEPKETLGMLWENIKSKHWYNTTR